MIARRELLIAAACGVSAGAAYVLKPRHKLSLLNGRKMQSVVPREVGTWKEAPSAGLVEPKSEGLAASLYNEIVQRTFRDEETGEIIMLLVAYGGTQSDVLQLHRPEVCYPALGFSLESVTPANFPLPNKTVLPFVRVVAVAGDRRENIVYWTRLGDSLPTSGTEQRAMLLGMAMKGFIPDGVLVRFSIVAEDSHAAFGRLERFVPQFLNRVPAETRPALVGPEVSRAISSV